jgi:predicted  nucleic acid-binding Zn-ribbon protein
MTSTGLTARSIEKANRVSEKLAARARDGKDGESLPAVVKTVERVVEKVPDTIEARLASIEAWCNDTQKDIAALDERTATPAVEPSQLVFVEKQLATLREEVASLKQRPHLSEHDINDLSKALNTRVKGMIASEVTRILSTERMDNVPANDDELKELARSIHDVGASALTHASMIQDRVNALEKRLANLPAELMVEVARAKDELKRRA